MQQESCMISHANLHGVIKKLDSRYKALTVANLQIVM